MTSEIQLSEPSDLIDHVGSYLPDDETVTEARASASDLGCAALSPAVGVTLRFLATTLQARAVVEIGTGAGVSGLYLLRGMVEDGVLTTIDREAEYQRAARRTFLSAGFTASRMRLIMGHALEVLPRLTAGGYDLIFVDAAKIEYPNYYAQAVQLLRPGGVIVFHEIDAERIGDSTRRDPESLALRELSRTIREDDRLVPALLPVGGGLLAATACG